MSKIGVIFVKKSAHMKFKTGDRVRFLNEEGGGIVKKVLSSKMVSVEIEDGFEIPTLTTDIVIDGRFELTDEPDATPVQENPTLSDDPPELSDRMFRIGGYKGQGEFEPGVYLGYIPQEQKWLITGLVDVYLINHTDYDILYSLILKKENHGFEGIDYGSVDPRSMVLIETIDRESLPQWSSGFLQVLFQKDSDNKVLAPSSTEFRIRQVKFYKEGSYVRSAFMEEKGVFSDIIKLSQVSKIIQDQKGEGSGFVEQRSADAKPNVAIEKHKTSPREAVVDLHIGELTNDYSKLENIDILKIQLSYFHKCLESAIAENLQKVTFIHGVGSGILKKEIKRIINDYEGLEYRDASMAKFGVGATDVIIKSRID